MTSVYEFIQYNLDSIMWIHAAVVVVVLVYLCSTSRYSGPRVIVVEGLIGAGKTTFIRSLSRHLEKHNSTVAAFDEDIDREFCDTYIADQRRYSFAFQVNQATSRRWQWKYVLSWVTASARNIAIVDRSAVGGEAFSTALWTAKLMSDDDFALCKRTALGTDRTSLEQRYAPDVCRIVFLDVRPETSLARTRRRANKSEVDGYTLEYMQALDTAYRRVLKRFDSVRYIDWNTDVDVDKDGLIPDDIIAAALKQIVN